MAEAGALRFPRWLAGAVILFWGWRTGSLAMAAPLAVVAESTAWIPLRFDFTDADFNRLMDLTALLLFATAVYQFDAQGARGIFAIVQLLPMLMAVLLLGQIFSTRNQIPLSALFWSLRRARAKGLADGRAAVDFRWPFLAMTILAASTGARDAGYLTGAGLLAAWAMWPNRPRRYRLVVWLPAIAAVGVLAFAGQQGIVGAQRMLQPIIMEWLQNRLLDYRDPYRNHTAIGSIGELKISDRIVLRVSGREAPPPLLREATYQSFTGGVWLAGDTNFKDLLQQGDGTTWTIAPGVQARNQVDIARNLTRGRGVLALPPGAARITGLNVENAQRNGLGAIKVSVGPDLISYTAHYNPAQPGQKPPVAGDLGIPKRQREAISEIAQRLGIANVAPARAALTLQSWFAREFRYSLQLTGNGMRTTPIQTFLRDTRAGHCEYFATSTVLLLRAAGIPARYAVGYSVQEYSPLEQAWLVRRRHAHSWALAWIDGRWVDVDTTPPGWAPMEARQSRWWWSVYDVFSWLKYRFTRWRLSEDENDSTFWWLWAIPVLVGVLIWRLARQRSVRREREPRVPDPHSRPLTANGFDRVVAVLARSAGMPGDGETLDQWLGRIQTRTPGASEARSALLATYYRLRFHPSGLAPKQRRTFDQDITRWLNQFHAGQPAR